MVRVLIVDDHPVVRNGIRAMLAEQPDIVVTGDAASGEEALAMARLSAPDIAILDISLPGMSGLEVLRHVRAEFPSVRVLMLSIYPERQYAVRCLKEGALGYLTKDAVADELVTALRTVSKGKRYVTARLGEVLAATVGPKGGLLPHERLSAREFEIFRLIGRGKTLVEIADVLAVKPSTISTHRSHILAKMRCRSTAQLVRYAVEHGLVDWHP